MYKLLKYNILHFRITERTLAKKTTVYIYS